MKLRKSVRENLKQYQNYRKSILTKDAKPCKELTYGINRCYGRNNGGSITVRHKMRGAKALYREISFTRKYPDMVGVVQAIEYDPNRSAFIALIKYDNNKYEYIIHPKDLKVGDKVVFSLKKVEIAPGNCTTVDNIPLRTFIHCVEMYPGRGAQIARSAGTYAEVIGIQEDGYALLKMMSGAVMKIKTGCTAVIGQVSNEHEINRRMYKAGQSAYRGVRPEVRGVAQNRIDHGHGGGRGKTGTKRHPISYTYKLTKGKKTANKNRPRAKFILKDRKR